MKDFAEQVNAARTVAVRSLMVAFFGLSTTWLSPSYQARNVARDEGKISTLREDFPFNDF